MVGEQQQTMPVRIAPQRRAAVLGHAHSRLIDKPIDAEHQPARGPIGGAQIGHGAPPGCSVPQQFQVRRGCVRRERHDIDDHLVQPVERVLRRAMIHLPRRLGQAERRVERGRSRRVRDGNGAMVDAVRGCRIGHGKLDQFHRMPVRITDLAGAQAARQIAGAVARYHRRAKQPKPPQRRVDIVGRQSAVLEPGVVGAAVTWGGAPRRVELPQLQLLATPPQHDAPGGGRAEQPRHCRRLPARRRLEREIERQRVERHRGDQIADREAGAQQRQQPHGRCAPRTLV